MMIRKMMSMPWILILLLLSQSVSVAPPSSIASLPPSQVSMKPTCPDSLQALIDQTPPGGALSLPDACIFREAVVISRPITLEGNGVAEIRGSDVWTEWLPGDGVWTSAWPVPGFGEHGTCQGTSDGRCLWPEQVFRDGWPLRQIADGAIPRAGEFSMSADRHVVIADDPAHAVMEVTVRLRWVQIEGDDITVSGFIMKHAAGDAQHGGIQIDGANDWTVRENELSDAHGGNVYFIDAANGRLIGNDIFSGGQLGVGGEAGSVLIRDNRIHQNNTEAFATNWEAGGIKLKRVHDSVIERNHVFLNDGPGIWCDIDCRDVIIRDNAVEGNTGVGIFFEISDGADIAGNRVWENGWGTIEWGRTYDAGIVIANSRDARVHDNVLAWNGSGISVFAMCRGTLADGTTCDLAGRWNVVYGNEVHGNVVVLEAPVPPEYRKFALGWLSFIVDGDGNPVTAMFEPASGNRGYGNVYWFPEGEDASVARYSWGDLDTASLDEFNATPGEDHGRYLDEAERDRILNDAGIPLAPEDRR